MDFDEVDEMVLDIMSEFVNVVLGNIAVKFSEGNVKVDLIPPVLLEKIDYEKYLCFDFTTTQGNLTLLLKV